MSDGLSEPLESKAAKALIRKILDQGSVDLSVPHAQTRMGQRSMDAVDVENVLRAGVVEPAELERGTWRYRVSTKKMVVVICFRSAKRLAVITAWRN